MRSRKTTFWLYACTALLCSLALSAPALAEKLQTIAPAKPAPSGERRIALVIGNSAYKDSPLRNPANDARAISQALSATGFTVTVIEDATQVTMRRAIRSFGDDLARATVGLFYYAGHGMQVRGSNYLIPVNADIEREDEVADQAVDANFILTKMDSAKNTLNIMILDACRNNPFARSFRSGAKGLAQMDAPSGTLISFATAPGSVASDGTGKNGLYTEHLLKAVQSPGMPIEQVFKQVRIGVTKATSDQQIPWESSSLKGDFSFVPGAPVASAAQNSAATQQAVQKAVQDATRAADERVAREREEFQRKMEQMVQDALARQRAMLDAERKASGGAAAAPPPPAAVPVAAAPAPVAVQPAAPKPAAPVQVASAAPATVAPVAPVEMTGDRWRYTGVDAFRSDKKFESIVSVLGAAGAGVIETTRDEGSAATQWVYTGVPTLVGGAGAMVVFSPLIGTSQPLQVGQSWRDIQTEGLAVCNRLICNVGAQVEALETVTTPAGTFEAYRVGLTVAASGSGPRGRGEIVYWYSPKVKRIVKYKARTHNANFLVNMDAELAAYRLAGIGAAGKFAD